MLVYAPCPFFPSRGLLSSQKVGMKVVVSELVPANVCDAL